MQLQCLLASGEGLDTDGVGATDTAYVVGAGIGVLAKQPDQVAAIVQEWLRPGNPTLAEMTQRTQELAQPHGAQKIARIVLERLSSRLPE